MADEPLVFHVADIPPSGLADSSGSGTASSEYECEVCGTALTYAGKGRKPRFCADHKPQRTGTTTRRSSRDVDAAMAALSTTHSSLSFLLMLVAGDAAVAWEDSRPALEDRNRAILEGDPRLAKRLAQTAAKGGAPALVISHLIAIAPAASIAYGKGKAAREAARVSRETADDSPIYAGDVPTAPTVVSPQTVEDPVDLVMRRNANAKR